MKNPWKTLSTQKVYDNPWITVSHREVVNPAGNPGIYGVVHFKNLAIAIVPLDEEGNTFLVGQYRYTLNQYSWEVPEGGGAPNADPLESAKRELKEETGYSAAVWLEAGILHTSNSVTDEQGLIYIAKELTPGEAYPEETEQLVVRQLPLEEAVEMALRGEITDSLSVAALLKVYVLRQRGLV